MQQDIAVEPAHLLNVQIIRSRIHVSPRFRAFPFMGRTAWNWVHRSVHKFLYTIAYKCRAVAFTPAGQAMA